MTSHGVKGSLDGLIDLGAQTWALQVSALQTDAAGEESQDAAHLTVEVGGPWSAPIIRAIVDGSTEPAGDPGAH